MASPAHSSSRPSLPHCWACFPGEAPNKQRHLWTCCLPQPTRSDTLKYDNKALTKAAQFVVPSVCYFLLLIPDKQICQARHDRVSSQKVQQGGTDLIAQSSTADLLDGVRGGERNPSHVDDIQPPALGRKLSMLPLARRHERSGRERP
jgi:hypothetical protein